MMPTRRPPEVSRSMRLHENDELTMINDGVEDVSGLTGPTRLNGELADPPIGLLQRHFDSTLVGNCTLHQ